MHDFAFDNDLQDVGHTDADPASANPIIDLGDSNAVRRFVRDYLGARQQPVGADEVHDVTAAISRYKGPPLIRRETLESFLALMLAPGHA